MEMHDNHQPSRPQGIKFDLTVNIPVMLTMGTALVSGSMWISGVDAKASMALTAAQDAKQAQAVQMAATAREISVVRAELRDDLKDINSKVD